MTLRSNAIVGATTLGRNPGNVILAIAAIAFDEPQDFDPYVAKSKNITFFEQICIHSSIQAGFRIDADALIRWQNSSERDWTRAFGGQTPVDIALSRLSRWKKTHLTSRATIWTDAHCDLPAATHALAKFPKIDNIFDNVRDARDIHGFEALTSTPPPACPLEKCSRIGSLICGHAGVLTVNFAATDLGTLSEAC